MTFKTLTGKKNEEESKPQGNSKNKIEVKTDEPPAAVQLENAMEDNHRQDTQDSRSRVYQELLFSDLLLALVDGQAPNAQQPSENMEPPQSLNVAIMSNPQGVQFAAAFTSAAAAKRWRVEGGQYVSIRGQDIFKLLEPSPADVIVVNPGSSPFIALNKAEYRSLANGIVPQTAQSPVQAGAPANQDQAAQAGMQISFPPDAFTVEQKEIIHKFLISNENIEAAALGALLPPNAPDETSWLRTIFLRTKKLQQNQAEIQQYCIELRQQLLNSSSALNDLAFEVGIMPDANFWLAINQQNFTLFDNNPPKEPPKANIPHAHSGMRRA
jgi:hypothetical protein